MIEISFWILDNLSVRFPHIRQVSFRSNSHVINLLVFNRRRFALIILFPMCTNDKNLYLCSDIHQCVYTCVCVYVCERMYINSIFIHLRVVVKSYNTTNVTLVIQDTTKQRQKMTDCCKIPRIPKTFILLPYISWLTKLI